MSSDTAVGLYTGLTADQQAMNRYNQSFNQTASTGPVTTSGTSSETSGTSGVANTNSFQLNTTPDILKGLEAFIQQMTDRPAISQAELDKVAPLAVKTFQPQRGTINGGTWAWVDPTTGRTFYTPGEAERFNAAQQVKRQQLIQQAGIIKGGTEDQRIISDARLQEIERNRTTQANYTKEAAFGDAKALSGYFSRILMEQQLPGIIRSAEGAGTSQGSMRTLLQTRAAEVTAEQAAKLGLDAASSYGQVNNQLAGVLEQLTRQDPNSITAQLLQALSIGKGIQTSGSQSQATSQAGTKTGTQEQTQTGKTENQQKSFIAPSSVPIASLGMERPDVTPVRNSQAGTGYIIAHPPEYGTSQNNPNSGSGTPITFYDEEQFQV